jgi:hypothetical protein
VRGHQPYHQPLKDQKRPGPRGLGRFFYGEGRAAQSIASDILMVENAVAIDGSAKRTQMSVIALTTFRKRNPATGRAQILNFITQQGIQIDLE